MKCSACREACYCSAEHQRLHWKEHKRECKRTSVAPSSSGSSSSSKVMDGTTTKNSASSTSAPVMGDPRVLSAKLMELHRVGEEALRARDFERAVSVGQDGLKVAQLLPEPVRTVETVKVHLDTVVAFQHMRKFDSADQATQIAIQKAKSLHESKLYDGDGGKRICDLYMSSCLCRAHFLLDTSALPLSSPVSSEPNTAAMKEKLAEAKSLGIKALDLCRQLFPGDEDNLNKFKPLRILGLVKERLDDTQGAEKDLHGAYMCVVNAARRFISSSSTTTTSSSSGGGGGAGSSTENAEKARYMMLDVQQTLIDELIRLIMRRKDLNQVIKAEEYAQYDFDMVTKDRKFTNKDLPYADSLERLAKLQHNLSNKLPLADENMTLALKIKKAHFKDSADKQKQLRIADASVILAKIRESRDLLLESTEELLSSAASIYNTCRDDVAKGKIGTPFPFINTIDADITRLSLLMHRRAKSGSGDDDTASRAPTNSDGNGSIGSIGSNGLAKGAMPSSTKMKAGKKRSTGEKYTFAPEDGQGRMRAAATLYEDEHYSDAVVILQEAVQLFKRLHGSTHPYTENASNNLALAINQELNCLWREVLEELD